MNKQQIRGDWNQLKGEMKKRWASLTDDDLMEAEGDLDKIVGKIQKRTGDNREVIRHWLQEHGC